MNEISIFILVVAEVTISDTGPINAIFNRINLHLLTTKQTCAIIITGEALQKCYHRHITQVIIHHPQRIILGEETNFYDLIKE